MQRKIQNWIRSLFIVFITSWCSVSQSQNEPPTTMSKAEASFRAMTAYLYGYPLVTMDMIKRVMTNTVIADGSHAPMGQFINLREFPKPSYHDVTAPNVDMLYSFAWLNLAEQPYVLHVPDENGRYYIMPLIDAWTNVFSSLGARTTGTKAQDFIIVGPNWHGKLPKGLMVLHSPTDMVWIKARTYSTGSPDDLKIVHAIQDKYQLTPLSYYGKPYTPAKGKFDPTIDMKTPVREQVNAIDAATFFKRLAMLMKANPPAAADQPMIANLAKLGIFPGKDFDINKVDPLIAKALTTSVAIGQKKINAHLQEAGVIRNGWTYMTEVGRYGTHYLQRALMASLQPGATVPEDLVYPVTTVGSAGKQLTGKKLYMLNFLKGELPPVNGFWSLTMYDDKYFFVQNPLNRYNISQRDSLKENRNGSITIYVQHDSPGPDKESNWLPAPSGDFILLFRLYWPKEEILNGTWVPPKLKRIIRI